MKKVIKKLKFGVLLAGFIFFSSYGSNATVVSPAGINMVFQTIPSVAKAAVKYAENKLVKYWGNSSQAKNENRLSGKKNDKTISTFKAMPITIGNAGVARLVSSNDN
jgi:hypothetical protein